MTFGKSAKRTAQTRPASKSRLPDPSRRSSAPLFKEKPGDEGARR